MVKKLVPVGEGSGTFSGVESQSAATLMPTSSSRRRPAPLTDEQRAEIVRLYVGGATVRDVANRIGRSYGTVHRVLTDEGVTMRGRNGR
jgi:DNA-binding NarL/FixJ family response regulator